MKKILPYLVCIIVAISLSSCTCSSNKSKLVGADSDKYGCKASAGYVWSDVQKRCIRTFEQGVAVVSTKDNNKAGYIVLSADSSKLEFFSADKTVVLDRRVLPSGKFTWNVEDDDTLNITNKNGYWEVSQRGNLLYVQPNHIHDVKWKLSELNDRISTLFDVDKNSFTVTFTGETSAISGKGACNSFFGGFELIGSDGIKFFQGGSTLAACSEEEMKLEMEYIKMFNDAVKYKVENKTLTLYNSKGERIAVFIEQ